ncbi:shikimate dehydrogenase [Hydrocarboniclastica marina]|uniref:Shikimate dehydrogenase (NADP(+)) n=1 Tax=Hydrocarboniclastica marina TaxID=2259620 RepID=A0A4P7XD21_9ALTE|nr:shikimate dehydrogenase [Hydrocarboniclastica marina]MAM00478.1 shikimate dehydrogenase [Alteromonadaceae bacterium]QCF24495.1 shikimate dehydrogenase [Hydrocarboniclastica marina]|tara:strand:+ start:132 stop:947 length:816 start_codon:yes stop_codon:yes gene_type:complete
MSDLYAVIGHPVSHSKSPLIHGLFARQTGENVNYIAIQAPEDGFADTARSFFRDGGCGLNVTVPFKQEAYALAERLTDRARLAGAVNTLYPDAQGMLLGDNTDGVGLVTDLCENNDAQVKAQRVLVLGAGGAVRGVLGPLLEQHPAELVIANRTLSRAQDLAKLFETYGTVSASEFSEVVGPFDLIINGTSASLAGSVPPIPSSALDANTLCYDMMYSQDTTVFNRWALGQGASRVIDGLGMLVEQAAESFFLWRHRRPETEPVIKALRSS